MVALLFFSSSIAFSMYLIVQSFVAFCHNFERVSSYNYLREEAAEDFVDEL
jgi:hypothetical protein